MKLLQKARKGFKFNLQPRARVSQPPVASTSVPASIPIKLFIFYPVLAEATFSQVQLPSVQSGKLIGNLISCKNARLDHIKNSVLTSTVANFSCCNATGLGSALA